MADFMNAIGEGKIVVKGIEVMYQNREGVLWIGTHNGGLNRCDPATATDLSAGQFTH